jgi:hypothetical protein
LVLRSLFDCACCPLTEGSEFVRSNQGLVAGCQSITEPVEVFTGLGVARGNKDADPNSTKEERPCAVLLAQQSAVVECFGGSGVLTEDLITVPLLVKDNVVEGTCDVLLTNPVERPVTGTLE